MIDIRNVSFSYGTRRILDNISFKFQPGECVGILGNNGAGKSTLISCLNKILTPEKGEVYINDENITRMSRLETARRIAYVAQRNEMSQTTVFDTVLLGRKPYIKWSISQSDLDLCDSVIAAMGMSDFKLRYINQLSGGEVQKVMLARALVQQPKLLLLDEPTSNLDPKNQHEMLALVKRLASEHQIGVLLVIHDLNLALQYCDKYILLKDNQIHDYGGEEIITAESIEAVYGLAVNIHTIDGVRVIVPKCQQSGM